MTIEWCLVVAALDVFIPHLISIPRSWFVTSGLSSFITVQIAVKEVQFRDPKSIDALQEEINMHKRWRHPHIVQYLGSEVDGCVLRIFLEQVPGKTEVFCVNNDC